MQWGGEVREETQVVMESPPPTPWDAEPVRLDIPLSSELLSLRFWGVDTCFWVCVCPSLSAAPPPEPLAAPRSQPAAPGLCLGRFTLLWHRLASQRAAVTPSSQTGSFSFLQILFIC